MATTTLYRTPVQPCSEEPKDIRTSSGRKFPRGQLPRPHASCARSTTSPHRWQPNRRGSCARAFCGGRSTGWTSSPDVRSAEHFWLAPVHVQATEQRATFGSVVRVHSKTGFELSVSVVGGGACRSDNSSRSHRTTHRVPRPLSISNPVRLRFDDFELDEANAWLLRDGKAVALAPTPFSLLCALARQPGALLTKDALLDAVWGHQFVSESVLKTAISDLRTALGDNPREPRFIETVSRRGYRFIAVPAAAPAPPHARRHRRARRPAASRRRSSAAPTRSPGCSRAWDQACSGQRAVVWVAGEPGIGKTTLIEHFVAGLGGVAVRARPVRGALRHRRALPAGAGGAGRAVPQRRARCPRCCAPWRRPGCCSCRGSAPRRNATRCGANSPASGPDRMLREMGELLDRYTEQRPLLLVTEDLHWSDRATIQLIDHVARRRGRARLMWLASFRLAEVVATGPSAQSVAARAAPAPAVRGDRARPVLRDRGRRLHRAALAIARARRGLRACAARAHRRRAAVRLVGHHRGDGAHRRTARRRRRGSRRWRCPRTWRPSSTTTSPARQRAARAARGGRRLRRRVPGRHAGAGPGARRRLGGPGLRRAGARARVARRAACRQRRAMRPEPPYSFRHALFRQVLYDRTPPSARMQLHREVGAALERERAAGVAVAAVGAGDALRPRPAADGRAALLRRGGRSRAAALQPRGLHEPGRARAGAGAAGAGGGRARRAGAHARDAARHVGLPLARRRLAGDERLRARLRAAGRRAGAPDARAPAAWVRLRVEPARRVRARRWWSRSAPKRSRRCRTIRR